MSQIKITNLSFTYPGASVPVFENLDLVLDTDWRLAFTGRNGRGKTTFLKLLAGEYEHSGSIKAGVEFEYFPYAPRDAEASCAAVAAEFLGDYEPWRLDVELYALGLGEEILERKFSTLSGGERTKLLIAAMFLRENSFLLIDEPTNHLDAPGRALLGDYLAGKSGFILVSHDRAFLDGCVDHVLSINREGIDLRRGSFSAYLEDKDRRDAAELAENERLRKDVRRLEDSARRASEWSDKTEAGKYGARNSGLRPDRGFVGHKAAKMMSRAKNIEGRKLAAAEEKSGLLKNVESAEALKLSPMRHYAERLAEFRSVSVAYGERGVFRDLSFSVTRGARLAIAGGNGSGKTSVLRLLRGEDVPHTGEVYVAPGLKISYVGQDVDVLSGAPGDYARALGVDESLFFAILRKFDFPRELFSRDMAGYSAGQKKKVLLAGSLCEQAHLYVWDEPLNYVDLYSRMQLERLILDYEPSFVFVEHDRAFREAVATEVIEI